MPYTWILFDADGTLFDYDTAEATALAQTLAQFGCPHDDSSLASYRRINADLWHDFEKGKISQDELKELRFERLFAELALHPQPDILQVSRAYLQNLSEQTALIDGAYELLMTLRGHVHLGLITNGLAAVQRPRLARSPIADAFDVVVVSEEVGAAKPDARIFAIAFSQMGTPRREDVLIVGDSLTSDIAGGIAYGIDTAWYNPDRLNRPDGITIRYEIHQLADVLSIVGLSQEESR